MLLVCSSAPVPPKSVIVFLVIINLRAKPGGGWEKLGGTGLHKSEFAVQKPKGEMTAGSLTANLSIFTSRSTYSNDV